MVFLENVIAQELDVGASMAAKALQGWGISRFGVFDFSRHGPQQMAAQLVFVPHHAGGTLRMGKALAFQKREQVVLFFAVMAAVGKIAEKVECLSARLAVKRSLSSRLVNDSLQAGKHLLDDAMFILQDLGRLHHILLSLRSRLQLSQTMGSGRLPSGTCRRRFRVSTNKSKSTPRKRQALARVTW